MALLTLYCFSGAVLSCLLIQTPLKQTKLNELVRTTPKSVDCDLFEKFLSGFFRVCLFFRFSFRCEISLKLDPVEFHSNSDPLKNSDAEEFQSISIREAAVLVPDDKLDRFGLKDKNIVHYQNEQSFNCH